MNEERKRWLADYERTGYLVVEDMVDMDTIHALRAAMDELAADPDSLPPKLKQHIMFERARAGSRHNKLSADEIGNAIHNVMEVVLFNPVFAKMIFHERQLDVLEALFGSTEFAFLNYKCIVKAPRVSSVFRWHRDFPYLNYTTPNLITSMICLDDMTPENGATVVLPGSHHVPQEQVTAADREIAEEHLPKGYERVMVCCPAGSAVLFHVNILHGGPANRSPYPRRNLISIWAGPDTYPTEAFRLAYQGTMPRSTDPARQLQNQMTQKYIAGLRPVLAQVPA